MDRPRHHVEVGFGRCKSFRAAGHSTMIQLTARRSRGFRKCRMMVTPRFIFHIGAHKAGTTFLQTVFHAVAPALKQRGLLEPIQWHRKVAQPGHHQLPIDLKEGSIAALTRDMKAVKESGASHVLISAEGLGIMPEPAVKLLGSLLGGTESSFVFYCRRWSDLLPSHWQTLVRGGISTSLPETIRPLLRDPHRQPAVNFGLKLDMFARVFGREKISIASYSNVMDSKTNLAHHFFETFLPEYRVVLDSAPEVIARSSNTSLQSHESETIRCLNALARRYGETPGSGPSGWFMRKSSVDDRERIAKLIAPARRTISVDDNAPRLRALHNELFRAWRDRFADPRSDNGFFEPRERELVFISPGRAEAPAVKRVLLALYDEYRRDTGLPPRAYELSS
jgi:hypothetical protein